MEKKLLSIIVPMYYEELVAYECYHRIKNVVNGIESMDHEIIFVNDGSKDRTLAILKSIAKGDKCVKIIDFSRNFGHQAAVTAGLFNCNGDAIVIIDADLQDPPEIIPEMISKWEEGHQVIYGKRKIRSGESKFKLLTAKYFYRVLSYMASIEIPKDTGDFRLMDRIVVEAFKEMPEQNRFIRGMVSWIGFDQVPLEYNRDDRFAGETKYPLRKMIKFATDGIVSFSTKPLKLTAIFGIGTIGISILLIIYTIITKIMSDTSMGWASTMCVILFFSGVQLLSLGVIGEYIARIYDESKNRPLYLVKEKINFDNK
ncbi:MAG: glycosyltransferase family 2 protein [Sarcina ventriculi]|nr:MULTISPECIES: glycosyltransferase family 2 protein [Sarcina]MDO4401623.1 glycosyltransferase family 2 protein [Clostridiaceae bacterium]MCI5635935.1 glycosyltransferase family 2 protein [Sarcina ventriculi]MDD7372619.1 glycosyltransferase family 2 protein [Sarcina ventriculi]MDY7061562.1 glycosyltransferase family 2 protein [Sarcina ventriculi]CUO16858.1 Bactoprenol glucosyl transferase homolog from prophage CPS-53 [Sarcina ventriculi]